MNTDRRDNRKILLTNDDGINASGLRRLAETAKEFGEVWIVAPDSERSGRSHSITVRKPIEVWPVEYPVDGLRAFACNAMPADCIRVGVRNMVPGKPDVVLSGINNGYNMAADLQYSATAGAALEAAFLGVQAIAFSESTSSEPEIADRYLREILAELLEKPLARNEIWNVNFPAGKLKNCNGILRGRAVSQDIFYNDRFDEETLPSGRTAYTLRSIRDWNVSDGTDVRAVVDGYISIGVVRNIY